MTPKPSAHPPRYAPAVALLACPFCREMFEVGEATSCPVCGMALKDFAKLPPSMDAEQDGAPTAPEVERLPATYLGRGRGALALSALLGLGLFFLPWINVTLPDNLALSGFDIARRLGWSWGAGVAWFVLLPTVLSRRSILQMRGARVAAAFLALVPAATVTVLLTRPPRGGMVPLRFTFGWALYGTLTLSLVASVVAILFGGRLDDIRVARGTSQGQTLH